MERREEEEEEGKCSLLKLQGSRGSDCSLGRLHGAGYQPPNRCLNPQILSEGKENLRACTVEARLQQQQQAEPKGQPCFSQCP